MCHLIHIVNIGLPGGICIIVNVTYIYIIYSKLFPLLSIDCHTVVYSYGPLKPSAFISLSINNVE